MKITVCDICEQKYPDAKIKYKYRGKKWDRSFERWKRVELCQDCLDKIIAKTSSEYGGMKRQFITSEELNKEVDKIIKRG